MTVIPYSIEAVWIAINVGAVSDRVRAQLLPHFRPLSKISSPFEDDWHLFRGWMVPPQLVTKF
jgi:hypothetical protein